MSTTPPKARLTFRVGIAGHRPNRLELEAVPSLTVRLAEVLSSVKKAVDDYSTEHSNLFADAPPCVRAVSPLAEGTDRYFAKQALRLGYELCCPLPFHKEEYENDFKPEHSLETGIDSVADFNSILKDAKNKTDVVLFELDGLRSDESEAYGATGRVVLNQSDLLIIVWDGCGNNKRGGTYETLKEACIFNVPVLWIDARAPHSWRFLLKESEFPNASNERCVPQVGETTQPKPIFHEIKKIVDQILEPPKTSGTGEGHHKRKPDLRTEYFAEAKPTCNVFFVWKTFRDLFGSFRLRLQNPCVPDFETAVAGDWPKSDPGVAGWVNTRLINHYAWADKLADYYADAYRSSFVLCYILGAVAVMLALIPVLLGLNHSHSSFTPIICSLFEFVAVVLILVLVGCGKAKRWHNGCLAWCLGCLGFVCFGRRERGKLG